MTKTGSANGSFFGNLIYERLLSKRDHFLKDLKRWTSASSGRPVGTFTWIGAETLGIRC